MIMKSVNKLVYQFILCCAVIFFTFGGFSTSYADVVVFQQGTNGYIGAVDTSLISTFPDEDFSTFAELDMASARGITRQGLLRFEDIFGSGPNQIPLNATIQSATLTLTKLFVSNSPDGFGHRMLVSWNDTDTWNSMGSGVQFDGTEAESAVDFTLIGNAPNLQAQTVDVTQTLELWQIDPSINFGWVFEGGPTDGFTLGFASSDHATASFKPILTVEFIAQPQLTCVGFYPPLADGAVTVRNKRVLPLKAELFDVDSLKITDADIISPPVIQVFYDPGVQPAVDVTSDALSAGQGTDGNQFEFTGEAKWQFNLSTKNYTAAGTYTIKMVSGDESEYAIDSCVAQFVVLE